MKSRYVYRWGFAVLGVSAAVNLIVAVRVFFAMQNPVAYNIRVIEPPVITNVVASLPFVDVLPGESTPTNEVHALGVQPQTSTNHFEVASEQYHYMEIDGSPFFRLNGRNYAVGDNTAYGTVERIYPERIYLLNGGFVSNVRRVYDLVDLATSLPAVPADRQPRVQPSEESPHDTSKQI